YRAALALRRTWATADEAVSLLDDLGPDGFGYRRDSGLVCVVNFGDAAIDLPGHQEILLSSDNAATAGSLAPDTAVWLR
ncbi:MAG: DUF3459 domain-containing protein, partial [Acidimicrobiales bacterium]